MKTMNNNSKWISMLNFCKVSMLLAVLLVLAQLFVGLGAAAVDGTQSGSGQAGGSGSTLTLSVGEALQGAADHLLGKDNLSDWAALALDKAGRTVPDSYYASAKAQINDNKGEFSRITDVERLALTLGVLGYDPRNFEGYNLIDEIFNHERMLNQGINGPVYALLVLKSGNYILPAKSRWNQQNLLETVLQRQNDDGGWSLTDGGKSTVDVTAMTLTALSLYRDVTGVHAAVEKAVAWLSDVQLDNGGFNDSGDNSESVSQVIIALSSNGLDSAAFAKSEGHSALGHLLSFRQADGGFAHMSDLGTNGMATEQALLALLAYDSYTNKTGFLYKADWRVSADVRVEGLDKRLAAGASKAENVLEALEQVLSANGIQYHVEQSSFGPYITEIDHLQMGSLGGFDGWMFDVKRGGKWLFPQVAADSFELEEGDRVVFFYSNETQLVHSIDVQPPYPKADEPFTIKVQKSQWDWENNAEEISPADGVQVEIGGMTATTDETGTASFSRGLPYGKHAITVTGNRDNNAPSVARESQDFYLYEDLAEVSAWAGTDIQKVLSYGLMLGVSKDRIVFDPQRSVTRAEYVSLLLRLIGEQPAQVNVNPYRDVASAAWYAGAIARAKQLGVVSPEASQFRPDEPMNREELAVMTAKALKLEAGTTADFADLAQAEPSAIPYISAVEANGILFGDGGRFMPQAEVSREMAAAVAVRIYEKD